jgi:two-component sensor histidine kinase
LEYSCHAPDQQRWFQLRASRLEHAGEVYAVVAHHDISKRVLAEQERQALLAKAERTTERQHLLIRELHHRVKNSLATAQALLGATARSTNSFEEFYRSFAARLVALGRTHPLLTEGYWPTASVREMLRTELEPFNGDGHRIVLIGAPLELSADLAVPTGMAIHELATNAAICGALSVPSGRVEVVWDVERDAQGKCRLCLEWTEHGGPLSSRPAAGGSGPRCRSGCSRRSAMPRLRWSSTERACAFG